MVSNIHKSRPGWGRSISYCIFTLDFIAILMIPLVMRHEEGVPIIVSILLVFFVLLHIWTVLYCIFKLNSFVYIDDTKIWQKQYGKCVEIQFSDIQHIRLTIGFVQGYYHVVIHSHNKKISFCLFSKTYNAFMERCTNVDIKEKIVKLRHEFRYKGKIFNTANH